MTQSINATITTTFKNQGVRLSTKQVERLERTYKKLGNVTTTVARGGKVITNSFKRVRGEMKRTTRASVDFRKKFNFAWLSVMFGGMAIQKAFRGIFDSGFKAFRDLAGEFNPLNQAMTRLQAETMLLKFTLGEALAGALNDLLPALIPLIELIADWIERNPKWAAGIVLVGLALGTILSFTGQLMLFIGGMSMLGKSFSFTAFMGKILKGAWVALKVAVMFLWGSLKLVLGVFMAIGKFLLTNLLKGIGLIGKALLWLGANPVVLIIGGIILLIGWLVFLAIKMGGVGEVIKAVWRGILTVVMGVVAGILFLVEKLLDTLRALANAVGAKGLAATFASGVSKVQQARFTVEDFFLEKIGGTTLKNGPIEGYNPFSSGAFGGGEEGGTTNIFNIDGTTLNQTNTEDFADIIDEAKRTTGSTQTGD